MCKDAALTDDRTAFQVGLYGKRIDYQGAVNRLGHRWGRNGEFCVPVQLKLLGQSRQNVTWMERTVQKAWHLFAQVNVMGTVNRLDHHQGRNDEFCVSVRLKLLAARRVTTKSCLCENHLNLQLGVVNA